jgi:citrate synthase
MTKASSVERRAQSRAASEANWHTSITCIEPNKILVRGYALDEMMGRLTFGEGVYLLLMGELPSPSIGRLMEAVLLSSIDHGATPPSTLAARNVATSGAPLRNAVAAGILGFGRHHGADIEPCLHFLDSGLALVRAGATYHKAAETIVTRAEEDGELPPPGFGHRFHTRDPRAARLFQMALELEIEGEHIQMIRAVEQVLSERRASETPPINVEGAIAAVCGDIGISAEVGNALFIISRVPGLVAHVHEERTEQPAMRQIDPKDHVYDGPTERRLPETRK